MEEIVVSSVGRFKNYKRYSSLCKAIVKELDYTNAYEIDWESDFGRRIFFKTPDLCEYTVRLWHIQQTEKNTLVRLSVFRDYVPNF